MKLNEFIWNNYKETENGKEIIQIFQKGDFETILSKFAKSLPFNIEETMAYIDDLYYSTTNPKLKESISFDEAREFLEYIFDNGIELTFEDGEIINHPSMKDYFTDFIAIISSWLFFKHPSVFKPYYFRNNFDLLTKISDAFDFELPNVPLKRYKKERFLYYLDLCEIFSKFQIENNLSNSEFCAFLYDFAPNFLLEKNSDNKLPEPTQVWWIGGDKGGGDFDFLDNATNNETSFWQGNIDTKKGDILIMYCLSPRSYIHSVWRATRDGIADPFFHYYSNIYIGQGQKVPQISIRELKNDEYFSQNPLVRKNLQGINGYPLSSEDYSYLQGMFSKKGFNSSTLTQLYNYVFEQNKILKNEREVEINLIEPLLKRIGYNENDWIRQLSVRMGRGERNYPDYTFLIDKTPSFEKAQMLIESKFYIKNNKELEETFKQTWSYGKRLSAKTLVIIDKDAIWIYKEKNNSFDRSNYNKYYWKELENSDKYNEIKKLIGK